MKVVEPTGPFVLRIVELEQGENHLERVAHGGELALDPAFIHLTSPVVLRAKVYRAGDHVEVQGKLTAAIELTCDRCLAPVPRTLEAGLRIFAERRESRDRRPVEEVREDDLGIVYHDGRFVDLTDDVRQVVLVELPWHTVCRDECRGLCPRCGADLNEGPCQCGESATDNRWAPLRTIDPEAGGPAGESPGDRRES